MNDDGAKQAYAVGTSFSNLLFLVFLVLKLTKVIDWSWWWVTAPLWIPCVLLVIVFICICVFFYR